ncbi:DNA polymerase III subunit beta [Patescibacteria group bacterium]|nr:DNA polymerase III subunit beta [Patescibacteria group bacterium]
MRIICTQENLSHGLQLVSHIASKNISLPILNNVLIKAEKGRVSLLTTNLEIGIICQVRGKVEQEGQFTVQAKTLSDYISLLPKENVNLELNEQNLKIECRNSRTVMKGVEASEFPLIPEVETKNNYQIKTSLLKDALLSVVFAVAIDETRPEISGVYFKFEGDSLVVVATDSYRLAEKHIKLEKNAGQKFEIIIPLRTIQELIRILSSEEADSVTISSNENQILFSFDETKITSRVIEGQYPDYQQIIPKEHRTRAVIDTKEFINTIKRASLFCKPGGNDILIKLDPEGNKIFVSAANLQIGESEANQEAVIEGEENSIIFNYRFLLDGLQNINEEECIFEMNTSTNPGLLKLKNKDTQSYIIMPIKQ